MKIIYSISFLLLCSPSLDAQELIYSYFEPKYFSLYKTDSSYYIKYQDANYSVLPKSETIYFDSKELLILFLLDCSDSINNGTTLEKNGYTIKQGSMGNAYVYHTGLLKVHKLYIKKSLKRLGYK